MIFTEGDVVRFKSEIQPMTVLGRAYESKDDYFKCCFFNNEQKQQVIIAKCDTLEKVPPKALRKLHRKQNQTGLKSFFENHPLVIYLSVAIVSFIAGFGVPSIIQKISNQDLLTKGNYILNSEIYSLLNNSYIKKSDYNEVINENSNLKKVIKEHITNKNSDLQKQIDELITKREKIRVTLNDIRARNSPISWSSPNIPIQISKDEQDALDQIKDINQEIMILYNKL